MFKKVTELQDGQGGTMAGDVQGYAQQTQFYSGFMHIMAPKHGQQIHPGPSPNMGIDITNRDLNAWVTLVNYVRSWGVPNMYGARVPLKTPWNLTLMEQLAESTSDREVVQFMRYGWSLNHDGRQVSVSWFNHASAIRYPVVMEDYLRKEQALGCLLGLFLSLPWEEHVAVSPMSTRPKKNSVKRRVIMDLSWPHDGRSLNDGIVKDRYLEQIVSLQYPTVDRLCQQAATMTGNIRGYKIDMDHASKQVFMDVRDWPLLGVAWMKLLFFDKTTVMGSRSALYICQHVTSFIRHIMTNLSYLLLTMLMIL